MTTETVFAVALLPESILHTGWYAVLSSFVAINTLLYVSLSVFKILPKLYVNDFVKRRDRRASTRSIYPNGHSAPADYRPVPGSLAARNHALAGITYVRGLSFHPDQPRLTRPSAAATQLAALLDAERLTLAG
jgi:hypothetical protein